MKIILKALTVLLILSWTISATAQVAPVDVIVRPVSNTLEVFFLKDFDINSPASGAPIFFVDIINRSTSPQNIALCIELQSQRRGNLFRGETNSFQLEPSKTLTLSNNNLFTQSGLQRLVRYEVAEEIVNELLDDILATGTLPSDIYTFDIIAKPQNQPPLAPLTFDIRVSNPKRVDIIGPGNRVTGRVRDCERIFSNVPQFRWDSRMKVFRFILAEYAPGEDPENALNTEPRFTRIFVIGNGSRQVNLTARDLGFNDVIEQLPSNSFQYPASGTSLPLKPGKTYVYQFIGLVNSSSGFFTIPSEVYCFKVPKLSQLGAGRQQFDLILRNLLESDYDKLFGENGELAEYQPTGMTMDGKEVTLTEILTRLQKLKSKYSGYSVE